MSEQFVPSDEPIVIEIPREWARIAFLLAFLYYIVGPLIFYMAGA